MRQTWAALGASKYKTRSSQHKMRYTTPSSGRETCQTAGLIPTTCRLFRLARPGAATKLEDSAGRARSALSLAFSVQLLHQHGEHAFDFDGLLRQLFVVIELDQFQISSQ